MANCNKPLETAYIGDLPIDTLDSIPDYLLAERDVNDPTTGKTIRSLTRVPGGRLFGGGTFDNVTTLEPNNTITIGENQVVAGRVVNNGSYTTVEPADGTNGVDFLIIGNLGDLVMIQSTGFVKFPNGHKYLPGQVYYAGENGIPTTSDESGVRLFKALSSTTIEIQLSF